MTAQVALVIALLLLRIHTSERNMGWKNGGGAQGGQEDMVYVI